MRADEVDLRCEHVLQKLKRLFPVVVRGCGVQGKTWVTNMPEASPRDRTATNGGVVMNSPTKKSCFHVFTLQLSLTGVSVIDFKKSNVKCSREERAMVSRILLALGLGSWFDSTWCSLLARPQTGRMFPVKHGDEAAAIEEHINGCDAFFGWDTCWYI